MSFSLFASSNHQLEAQDREELLQTTRQLLTQIQALSSRISAVNEIANSINRSLNLEEILQILSKQAKWLLDFQHCSVCLKNDDGTFRLITLFGSQIPCQDCPICEKNPIIFALKTGQSQLNPPDANDTFLSAYPSKIILPLTRDDQVIGSLNFATSKPSAYSQEDLRIGYLLAVQLASAIRNARCFQEMKRLLAEMNVLYSNLEGERRKSDQLLLNILPEPIAHELKETGKVKPVYYDCATVLFTDFKGFTKIAEQLSPEALVQELDYCFSFFDLVSEIYKLEKLKTIGDSYMAVSGIPVAQSTHAIDTVLAALQIQAFIHWRQIEKMQNNEPYWEIRIGIHSGSLLAGVIGRKKFTYDVWGDTVNIASRMESSAIPGTINISQSTFDRVKDFFECDYRGKVAAKNKGEIDMYQVKRLKPDFATDSLGLVPNEKFNRIYSRISSLAV
ncbi:adenylate/guanylate cyclase domain-containing protein [Coleofasciculus sp.]|uniref:adenylate/guanylate cyclase domain-containing protein n=1 Tax=Coleofasciculus sp. TaxID=3100458 RepID=UPI0039F81FB8